MTDIAKKNSAKSIRRTSRKQPGMPYMTNKVYWLSPVPGFCETCDGPIHDKFYDAATKAGPGDRPGNPGPWACMCPSCFTLGPGFGKLGQGYGQEYTKQPDGKWLKTGG